MAKEKVKLDAEEVISLYKSGMSVSKISKKFGTYLDKVSKLLKENGCTLMNNAQKSKVMQRLVDWDKAIQMYNSGASLTDVANHFNMNYDFIRENFLKREVSIRNGAESHINDRRYTHKNIFSPMTNEGAYLLGWIMSDGNMVKDKGVRMFLHEEDKDHVEYLKNFLTDSPLKKEFREKTGNSYYGFFVVDIEIYRTLLKLGVEPRKSYNAKDIVWDALDQAQLPYFLLGMLEGDGHISKNGNTVQFIMYESTLKSMQERFLNEFGIVPTKAEHESRWSMEELRLVTFRGKGYFDLLTTLYIMTPDVKPLKRKFDRFIENCNRVANSKSKWKQVAKNSLNAVKV